MGKREGWISDDPGWEGLLERKGMWDKWKFVLSNDCVEEMIKKQKFTNKKKEREVIATVSYMNELQEQHDV